MVVVEQCFLRNCTPVGALLGRPRMPKGRSPRSNSAPRHYAVLAFLRAFFVVFLALGLWVLEVRVCQLPVSGFRCSCLFLRSETHPTFLQGCRDFRVQGCRGLRFQSCSVFFWMGRGGVLSGVGAWGERGLTFGSFRVPVTSICWDVRAFGLSRL